MENHFDVARYAALDSRGQTALKWLLKLNEQRPRQILPRRHEDRRENEMTNAQISMTNVLFLIGHWNLVIRIFFSVLSVSPW